MKVPTKKTLKIKSTEIIEAIKYQTFATDNPCKQAIFSADEKYLFVNSNVSASLWDFIKQEKVATFDFVDRAAISPDGKLLVYSNYEEQAVYLWNIENKKEICRLPGNDPFRFQPADICFSPYGKEILATGLGLYGDTYLWDTESKEIIRTGKLRATAFVKYSPSGKSLLGYSSKNTLTVFNAANWDILGELREHKSDVQSADFLAENQVISSGHDRVIKFWDLGSFQEIRAIKLKNAKLEFDRMAVSQDKKHALALRRLYPEQTTHLELLDLETGQLLYSFPTDQNFIYEVKYSPKNTYILSSGHNNLVLWKLIS